MTTQLEPTGIKPTDVKEGYYFWQFADAMLMNDICKLSEWKRLKKAEWDFKKEEEKNVDASN